MTYNNLNVIVMPEPASLDDDPVDFAWLTYMVIGHQDASLLEQDVIRQHVSTFASRYPDNYADGDVDAFLAFMDAKGYEVFPPAAFHFATV